MYYYCKFLTNSSLENHLKCQQSPAGFRLQNQPLEVGLPTAAVGEVNDTQGMSF